MCFLIVGGSLCQGQGRYHDRVTVSDAQFVVFEFRDAKIVVVSRLKMFLGRFWVTVRLRFPGDED